MNAFLSDMPLFVEVARQKSFTKASETLEIGLSTLSRRIKVLEDKLGFLLFFRDTRNVELTPDGAVLFDRCSFILAETQNTYDSAIRNMHTPSGLLRICMFSDSYTPQVQTALCDFAAKWPEIALRLTFVEHPVDMRTDPYDIAFLIDPAIAPPLIARKLLTIQPYLYASPALFSRFPEPAEPQDLYALPCIALDRFGWQWTLKKAERQVTVTLQPKYTFSSAELCREFVLAGHGIALLRGSMASRDEKQGRLVRVLPEWSGFTHDLKLVTAPGQRPARVRLFMEHMQACYAAMQTPAKA